MVVALAIVAQMVACTTADDNAGAITGDTTLIIDLGKSRTSLGEIQSDGRIALSWSEGDCIAANGQYSKEAQIKSDNDGVAYFNFVESLTYPCSILYPASFYKSATTINLPSVQTFSVGGVATNTLPMASYVVDGGDSPIMKQLVGVVHLRIKAASEEGEPYRSLLKVEFIGGNVEQVCGDFEIDYENSTLTPLSSKERKVAVKMNSLLLTSETVDVYIVVPAREYSNGYTIRVTDVDGWFMDQKKLSAQKIERGEVVAMPEFEFKPNKFSLDIGI